MSLPKYNKLKTLVYVRVREFISCISSDDDNIIFNETSIKLNNDIVCSVML